MNDVMNNEEIIKELQDEVNALRSKNKYLEEENNNNKKYIGRLEERLYCILTICEI